jgi:hypothetical protein
LAQFVARFPVESFGLFRRDDHGRWEWGREFPLGAG